MWVQKIFLCLVVDVPGNACQASKDFLDRSTRTP
jgi:hypothetical protein